MTSPSKQNQKKLADQVFEILHSKPITYSTADSFRKLYAHVESNKPISKQLLDKFTWFGFYHPKENKIENPDNDLGLILQAMTWQGLTESKFPDGKIRNLNKYKKQKVLRKLLV